MAAKKHFNVGDLIWAKMKGFPFWPGRIAKPPTDARSSAPKKTRHYVFFFGSENHAWIKDQNIVHHSEEMLQSASTKKKSNSLKLAIKQITKEAPKNAKLLVKAKKSLKKSREVSASGTEKKIAKYKKKVQRMKVKTESPKVRKKVLSKRRVISSRFTRRELQPGPTRNLHEPRPSDKKIGFIGLGKMGKTLVKHLLTSNHMVTIYDTTFNNCRDFIQFGVTIALTPDDVVQMCDIIFCCVSDSEAVKRVVFGNDGILSGLERSPPGSKGYVEMTTMDSTTSIEIAEAITSKGGRYLQATLCGTTTMAENGSLLILSAGDQQVFIDCNTCFCSFSGIARLLSYDVGCLSKINIINNMLIGISHVALAECLTFVERCNLNPDLFMDIVENSQLGSPLLAHIGESLLSRAFPNDTSAVKRQQKDLQLALSLDTNGELKMFVTAMANELFKRAKRDHYSDVYDVYTMANY
ncbi:cytokine-like nuclear factor N-PAC [Argiope bruennichi]|uniref:Cytokine-like nuclear factor N-PAC n=1 Tax=Argiope bruennichi TaxID=94029 RepID=A0A8T0F5B7_ARGBR|nr:cytokine-like nuclear factor N-PAC [Argiope bruennichi]KAF8785508.1 putative oxidoreductase GLYR1 like protein [Argiope bruennichi]